MLIYHIRARDISEAWFLLLRHILAEGIIRKTPFGASAGEIRKELDYTFIEIVEPATLPLIPVVPPNIPPPTDEKMIAELVASTLCNYQLKNGINYYGHHLEPQIKYCIEQYKGFGGDWDAGCLMASPPDNIFLEDPWCLKDIDTQLHDNLLTFIAHVRGLDLWQGFVYFSAALQLIKEHMAKEIGCKDGSLCFSAKSLCLPQHQWDISRQATRFNPEKP